MAALDRKFIFLFFFLNIVLTETWNFNFKSMNRPTLEPSDLSLFLFPIVFNVVVLLSIKYHLVSNDEDDLDFFTRQKKQ